MQRDTLETILNFFSIAVAVIIVAVPEGLPLSISIAMAFSIDTLKADKLLVKELRACEEMGSITEICTGKTATLTQNDLTVHSLYIGGQFITGENVKDLVQASVNSKVKDLFTEHNIFNSESRIEMSDDALYVPEGSSVEKGMLKFLQQNNVSI